VSLETLEAPVIAREGASDDMAVFHRTLAELCRAEMPLPRALRMLAQDVDNAELGRAACAMADEIEAGATLEDALGRHYENFPELYRVLVSAGVEVGDLPGVLEEIARHAGTRAGITDRLKKALTYPLTAACFVIAAGVVVLGVATPALSSRTFANPFGAGEVRLPPAPLTALAVAAVVLLGVLVVASVAWLRKPVDWQPRDVWFRLPVIGRLRLYAAKAGFASTLALLLRRELPLPRALWLTAAASDDKRIARQVSAMAERAEEGGGLAESLGGGELLPPSLLWLIETAEAGPDAARALEDVAAIYHRRLERAVDRTCAFLTPCFELAVGLVVLLFTLAYMFPGIYFMGRVMDWF